MAPFLDRTCRLFLNLLLVIFGAFCNLHLHESCPMEFRTMIDVISPRSSPRSSTSLPAPRPQGEPMGRKVVDSTDDNTPGSGSRAIGRAVNAAVVGPVMRLAGSYIAQSLKRHGFMSSLVGTPDGPVHMWEAAGACPNGPTVLLLHGLATQAAEYSAALLRLQKTSRKVIAVDLPGAGRSFSLRHDARTHPSAARHRCAEIAVRALCHAIARKMEPAVGEAPQPLTVIGHSLGGYMAVRLALDATVGPLVSQLVLVSPDGAPWDPSALENTRQTMHVDHYRDAKATARRNWQDKPLTSTLMTPFIWARFAERDVRFMVDSDMFEPVLAPEQLSALKQRILLIIGTREEFEKAGRLAYLNAALPAGYTLARLDVGHGDIAHAPAAMMDLISDFAAGP